MPRTVDPALRQLYERENPYVQEYVEIAVPDTGQVLRRWDDQLSVNPPRLSETPASTTQKSPGGGIMLQATAANLVSLNNDNAGGVITLDIPDTSRIVRGVGWAIPGNWKPTRLRRFSAKIKNVSGFPLVPVLELQIFRMRGVPGRVVNNTSGAVIAQIVQYTPTPLLSQPARYQNLWNVGAIIDATWELSAFEFDVEHRNVPAPSLTQVGEVPEYIFEVTIVDPVYKNFFEWRIDNTSSRSPAGLGTFQDVLWNRPNPDDPNSVWQRSQFAEVPCFTIDIDTYPATSVEVYALTLPKVPSAASTGRVVFIRENPAPVGDGAALLELSSTSSSAGFAAVSHGDAVSVKQQNYWLRLTLNASADTHRSPIAEAIGIEFRTPADVSVEATIEPIPQDVNVPFLDSAIGEGRATVIRTGQRDYHDPASDILAFLAATQLECDYWIGSKHPSIARAQWFHNGRAIVTSEQDTPTAAIFSLISYAKILKRKIPLHVETVNAVLVAQSGTTVSAIQVGAGVTLPGTSTGDEYDGQNYYIRLLSTAVAGLAAGMIFGVAGNTGTHQIDLASAMPAALAIGDTFEIHSATYQQTKLSWADADPADVWYEILTTRLGVPSERIGLSSLGRVGRAGLPPKLTDRAPSDTATQNKLRVSLTMTDQEEAKAGIDELSFIMGGATLEIEGQIVWRPFYDLLSPTGVVVIPPEEVAVTFDVRDIVQLDTPRGLESRITTMSCTYGVDSALGQDAAKPSTVVYADADAAAWFTQQDLEEIGNSSIPDEIARWCYNSYDGGQYLANKLCEQVVRVFSTGLRQWSLTLKDMHPELIVGDRIVVMTDQYVDYDPTTKTSIRGLWAFPLVLTHVARNGRELRGFVPGLFSAVPVKGGTGAVSVGTVGQPSIGNIELDAAGNLLVTLNMTNPQGGGFRVAASTSGLPSDATVDAATFVPGTSAVVNLGAGAPWPAGATIQIKAIAYASTDTGGARSVPSTSKKVVPGGSSGNTFTSVSQPSVNYTTNVVTLAWVWAGAAATFNVWVSEFGNAFSQVFTGVGGSSVGYTSSADLVAGPTSHPDHIKFYVEAIIGGSVVATSAVSDVVYFRA